MAYTVVDAMQESSGSATTIGHTFVTTPNVDDLVVCGPRWRHATTDIVSMTLTSEGEMTDAFGLLDATNPGGDYNQRCRYANVSVSEQKSVLVTYGAEPISTHAMWTIIVRTGGDPSELVDTDTDDGSFKISVEQVTYLLSK